jgi:hypothetical protein
MRTGGRDGGSEKSHHNSVHRQFAAEVKNDRLESVMKLAQAHDVSVKTVHATLHKDLLLSGSRPAERSNCFTRRRRRSNLVMCQAITAMTATAF